jgi:ribonuclease T1
MNTESKIPTSRLVSAIGQKVAHAIATATARAASCVALGIVALSVSMFAVDASARTSCPLAESVKVKDLPKQARDTLALIQSRGPFPHDRDGITFQNRERILPKERRGYYKEYTVRTPGVKHRGARRIVCGGDQRAANDCYYTADHYKTFQCIAP